MTHELPSFENPPVIEVVLGATFAPSDVLDTVRIVGLWREHYESEYPIVETKPPYSPPVEEFGLTQPEILLEVSDAPPEPRFWFSTAPVPDRLVQVQNGWFACNWRKAGENDAYPRYETAIRPGFETQLERLEDFVANEGGAPIEYTQCEITYINLIEPGAEWKTHSEMGSIIRALVDVDNTFVGAPDESRLHQVFTMRDESGETRGRLRIDWQPVFRTSDRVPLVRLGLTARGEPTPNNSSGVLGFLDLAREWVVKGFDAITTDDMHEQWGRHS